MDDSNREFGVFFLEFQAILPTYGNLHADNRRNFRAQLLQIALLNGKMLVNHFGFCSSDNVCKSKKKLRQLSI